MKDSKRGRMMIGAAVLCALVALTLASGCARRQARKVARQTPVHSDPIETPKKKVTVDAGAASFRSASLAVVVSDNTRLAAKHLTDFANTSRSKNRAALADVDPKQVTDGINRVLAARFKQVTMVTSMEAAREANADFTMIFDVRVVIGKAAGEKNTVELSGIFVDDAKNTLEKMNAEGTSTVPRRAFPPHFREAMTAALDGFAAVLNQAEKLKTLVGSRRAPPDAAPGTPSVPPLASGIPSVLPLEVLPAPSRRIAAPVDRETLQRLAGSSWALVIGIDEYKHADRLNYAANDARSVAKALAGLGFKQVRTLLDGAATKAAIEQMIYVDLKKSMGPEDRLFVFFAGHGITVPLPRGGEEGYLIPVDGDPKRPEVTAISMDEVRKMGKRATARQVLVAIDACFSGFALTRDIRIEPRADVREALRESVVQVLTAGRKGQKVLEEDGHGLFTKRLLDGLRGLADRERRGFVTASELAGWLSPRVIRDSGERQHPQFSTLDGEGDFVFILGDQSGSPAR